MTLVIGDIAIDSICIVDDDPHVRESYRLNVEDLHLRPVPVEGPLGSLDEFGVTMRDIAQAAVCDHSLRVRSYAIFNGAALVALQYKHQFPAILCTMWETAEIDAIRPYRRWIPALLRPDDLDPDSLVRGLECCIREFRGCFQPSRRPLRTLVRVDHVDTERHYVGVVVPGWEPRQGIALPLAHLPREVRERAAPEVRFYAQVNIEAETSEELYFEEWEVG